MPYCPHCGKEVPEDAKYCESCGEAIITNIPRAEQKGLIEHIKSGIIFAVANPVIFIPEALAGLWGKVMVWVFTQVGSFFDLESWYNSYYPQLTTAAYQVQDYENLPPEVWQFALTILLLSIIWVTVSGLFTFTLVRTIWNIHKYENPDLVESFRYVGSRFGRLFLAAFIGNILTATIILIPAVLYMYAVMVVDETGIREGLSKGFSTSLKRLGASVVLIAAYFGLKLLFDYIPYAGDILFAVPGSIITVIFVDLYLSSK
jgi:hypothetical protein